MVKWTGRSSDADLSDTGLSLASDEMPPTQSREALVNTLMHLFCTRFYNRIAASTRTSPVLQSDLSHRPTEAVEVERAFANLQLSPGGDEHSNQPQNVCGCQCRVRGSTVGDAEDNNRVWMDGDEGVDVHVIAVSDMLSNTASQQSGPRFHDAFNIPMAFGGSEFGVRGFVLQQSPVVEQNDVDVDGYSLARINSNESLSVHAAASEPSIAAPGNVSVRAESPAQLVLGPGAWSHVFEAPWERNAGFEIDASLSRSQTEQSSNVDTTSGSVGASSRKDNGNASERATTKRSASTRTTGTRTTGKRPLVDQSETETGQALRKLACPFYKRRPHIYQTWRSCPGPGWDNVHRLKEHLYRVHPLIQYERCGGTFKSDVLLKEHRRNVEGCPRRDFCIGEGVSQEKEKQLRSRKRIKSASNYPQTEEDKWYRVYHILFPDDRRELTPSPYYSITDSWTAEPDMTNDYANFLELKLPPLMRQQLEYEVEAENKSLEPELRRRLPEIIQSVHRRLFRMFQHEQAGAVPERQIQEATSQEQPLVLDDDPDQDQLADQLLQELWPMDQSLLADFDAFGLHNFDLVDSSESSH